MKQVCLFYTLIAPPPLSLFFSSYINVLDSEDKSTDSMMETAMVEAGGRRPKAIDECITRENYPMPNFRILDHPTPTPPHPFSFYLQTISLPLFLYCNGIPPHQISTHHVQEFGKVCSLLLVIRILNSKFANFLNDPPPLPIYFCTSYYLPIIHDTKP